jgi:biopolymer transport protein ExbB
MLELIFDGGQLVWLLVGCSVLTFAVFLERYLYFHRASVDVGQLLEGLANLIRRKNFAEAMHQCSLTPGPVARVMRTALMRHDYPREYLRDIVQEAGQLEVPRVERSLRVLLTVAYVAPLIGLLGTLLGLLETFREVDSAVGGAASFSMAGGIYRSLVTSATGLIVAIPAYVLYSFLVSRAKNLIHEIERGGIEVINLIEDSRQQSEIISISDREMSRESTDKKKPSGGGKRASRSS